MVAILNLCSHTYNTILFVLYPFHSPIDTVSSGTGALWRETKIPIQLLLYTTGPYCLESGTALLSLVALQCLCVFVLLIDEKEILKFARAQYRRSSECAERAKLRGMYCDRSLSVSVAVSDLNWLFLMPAYADKRC